jgi:hypothetical protein
VLGCSPVQSVVVEALGSSLSSSTSSSPPRPASPEPAESALPAKPLKHVVDDTADLQRQLAVATRYITKLQAGNAKLQQRNRVLQAASSKNYTAYHDLKAYLAKLSWVTEGDVAHHQDEAFKYYNEA